MKGAEMGSSPLSEAEARTTGFKMPLIPEAGSYEERSIDRIPWRVIQIHPSQNYLQNYRKIEGNMPEDHSGSIGVGINFLKRGVEKLVDVSTTSCSMTNDAFVAGAYKVAGLTSIIDSDEANRAASREIRRAQEKDTQLQGRWGAKHKQE